MADLLSLHEQHKDLPEKAQKQAGKAIAGEMEQEYVEFLQEITRLVETKEIDMHVPETFLKKDIYDPLPEEARGQVDLALVNIADQLRHIVDFYTSKQTPDSSPQLVTMIEHLWQMKSRLEEAHGDVLKF